MLKVLYDKWNQSPKALYEMGLSSAHPRTRERFMALYRVTNNESATKVASSTGRSPHTVWQWISRYNEKGPSALTYKRSGGHPPFAQSLSQQ